MGPRCRRPTAPSIRRSHGSGESDPGPAATLVGELLTRDTRPRLVLATLNRAKGRELADLLTGLAFDLRPLADVAGATLPEETGASYEANALLKARHAARTTGELSLGDDSGLEVDALDGAPGIRSARYAGPGLDDAGRCSRRCAVSLASAGPRASAASSRSPTPPGARRWPRGQPTA
jgi:hypothetical protein